MKRIVYGCGNCGCTVDIGARECPCCKAQLGGIKTSREVERYLRTSPGKLDWIIGIIFMAICYVPIMFALELFSGMHFSAFFDSLPYGRWIYFGVIGIVDIIVGVFAVYYDYWT